MYSKKARVEAMVYLSQYEGVKKVLLEDTKHRSAKTVPEFYLQEWIYVDQVARDYPLDSLKYKYEIGEKTIIPRFMLFYENYDLDKRVNHIKTLFPNIEYETTIHPGFVDKVMHWLNPQNVNQTIHIYRNNDFKLQKRI